MKAHVLTTALSLSIVLSASGFAAEPGDTLDSLLLKHGFTGKIEEAAQKKLGRTIDPKLSEVGRLIFFDKGLGIHQSNSCSGCHSPTRGFGDTQPIAIGVGNNNAVGPSRTGARNQRRTPMLTNIGLYPALMWNGRFASLSGDPFDNSAGYIFPIPESRGFFPARDQRYPHLLVAQAHIPFTELPEMAGFGGLNSGEQKAAVVFSLFNSQRFPIAGLSSQTARKLNNPMLATTMAADPADRPINDDEDFKQFDDVASTESKRFLPEPYSEVPSRNNPVRHRVIEIINSNAEYRTLFGQIFPSVDEGNAIEFHMIGQALSEFQLGLTFANAPIDRYARGERTAMSDQQKKGAVIFFGKGNCVSCHAVSGNSNEMFSDFRSHNAGVPSIAPVFGKDTGNVPFRDKDGVLTIRGSYDMGLFDITALELDRFKFRTSPLRNIALQANFFHNGSFDKIGDAVHYHLNAAEGAKTYKPSKYGVPANLQENIGDMQIVLEHLAPQLRPERSPKLSQDEEAALVAFIAEGLLDPRAKPEKLRELIPASVPSGAAVHFFE